MASASEQHTRAILGAVQRVGEQKGDREGALARMRACLEEYEALGATLTALPERVERPAMVPLGKLALFPGTLRHTNEVTVLLGENLFALRSASQAVGIAERRAEFVAAQVQSLEEEVRELGSELEKLGAMHTLGLDRGSEGGGGGGGDGFGLVRNPDGTVEIREEFVEAEWSGGGGSGGGGGGGGGGGDADYGGGIGSVGVGVK